MDALAFYGLQRTDDAWRWRLPIVPSLCSGLGALFGGVGLGSCVEALERSPAAPWSGPPVSTSRTRARRRSSTSRSRRWCAGTRSRKPAPSPRWTATRSSPSTPRSDTETSRTAVSGRSAPTCRAPRTPRHESSRNGTKARSWIASRCAWRPLGTSRTSTAPRATGAARSGSGSPVCSRCRPPRSRSSATTCRSGSRRRSASTPAATASTTRCASRAASQTEWILADIRVHAVEDGFGHGLVHLWAENGKLLGTASQSTIVRAWRDRPPRQTRERADGTTLGHHHPVRGSATPRAPARSSRSSPTSATPTCGRARPMRTTRSPRSRSRRRGRRRCGSARPWYPSTRGALPCSRRRSRASSMRRRDASPSGSARRRTSSSSAGTASRSRSRTHHVRDTLRFLRAALAGEKVTARVRDLLGQGLPARRAHRTSAADPRRRAAAGDAQARRTRGRRRDHQLALRRRRADGRADRRRGQGDRGPHLRAADRGSRRGALVRSPHDRHVPERRGVRGVPRVARPGRAARHRCGPRGRRATAPPPPRRSPTRCSTISSSTDHRRRARSTCSATWTRASPHRSR